MWVWLWIIGFAMLVLLAAKLLDRHRGSFDEYRSADLPPAKKGGPREHPDIDTSWG